MTAIDEDPGSPRDPTESRGRRAGRGPCCPRQFTHTEASAAGVTDLGVGPADAPADAARRSRRCCARRPAPTARPTAPPISDDVAIRLEHLTKVYPGADPPGGRGPRPHRSRGRAGGAGRSVGLRQDHHAADDQPPGRADRRHGVARRHRQPHAARPRAAPGHRLRHPAGGPVPAPHGARQHRHRAQAARAGTKRPHPRPRRRAGRRWSASTGGCSAATRRRCPAASSSGSAWPGRWPPIRRCC